eukprot:TRINITY_DN18014_c0_g1_i1.p1 TRINITY_DN18014_c0_g1~~TRINITY_DN18014_c0_g1_i1.p1  ORF type:complete len:845 (+),score=169.45 TRINITY_DN18014_c0_g1_i1:125-2659(+)
MSRVCDVGERAPAGILPLLGDTEQRWPTPVRAALYLLGLCWCFMGVAVISDVFMSAIERITAQKTRKYNPTTARYYTVLVWNPTVANLTLMALGSSAPEILLSVIEVFVQRFYSGDLGPSTVVGSAAFNLLVITAICCVAIPDGEVRRIKEFGVYVVTAVFSLVAYLWLSFILSVNSPSIVEPWEGIMTFLYFPILVWVAYAADRGCFAQDKGQHDLARKSIISADMEPDELSSLAMDVRQRHGQDLTDEQVCAILQHEGGMRPSRAQYRIAATRSMTGGKRVSVPSNDLEKSDVSPKTMPSFFKGDKNKVIPLDEDEEDEDAAPPEEGFARVQFYKAKHAVLENAGHVSLLVLRDGDLSCLAAVHVKTREGAAKELRDFHPIDGVLEFQPGETEKVIKVTIVDDVAYEDDEEFFVDLSDARDHEGSKTTVVGRRNSAEVLIIDDDKPGELTMAEEVVFTESGVGPQKVELNVERVKGGTGKVTCKYKTENDSAVASVDYEAAEGELVFEDGVIQATISLTILPRGRYDRTEMFRVILTEVTGGARFDRDTDGGADSCICTIKLEADPASKEQVDKVMSTLSARWEKAKVGHSNWAEQFREAFVIGADEEGEDGEEFTPGVLDYILHALNLPWKILFALVPPTDFLGGWLCFVSSLAMIGLVTAIIGDMASLAGCVLDIPDEITAITLVALGTSLPDTFASKTAAIQEPCADASICNVTGSNSVNVFLGVGLPWMIASLYWRLGGADDEWTQKYAHEDFAKGWEDGAFVVKAGKLNFSVTVFSICAVFALILLYLRRRFCGGELGGPKVLKYVSTCVLISLWFVYLVCSIWYILDQSRKAESVS